MVKVVLQICTHTFQIKCDIFNDSGLSNKDNYVSGRIIAHNSLNQAGVFYLWSIYIRPVRYISSCQCNQALNYIFKNSVISL